MSQDALGQLKHLKTARARWPFPDVVIVRKTKGGSYILGELDSALSKLRFTAFRLIPYLPRDIRSVPVTRLTDIPQDELEDLTHDSGNILDVDFNAETN